MNGRVNYRPGFRPSFGRPGFGRPGFGRPINNGFGFGIPFLLGAATATALTPYFYRPYPYYGYPVYYY